MADYVASAARLRRHSITKLEEWVQGHRTMPRLFAFLRAVNAGRRRAVRMDVLHQAFASLGFFKVATFLGSGNVVFETESEDLRALERKIERKLQRTVGYNVPVFIRTNQEVKKIVTLEP